MTQHALYRFRDAAGQLLYIGVSLDPTGRFRRHQRRTWWTDVAAISIEVHPDRSAVLAAEASAIRAEKPLHNVQHTQRLRPAQKPVLLPRRCLKRSCHNWAGWLYGDRPYCVFHLIDAAIWLHRYGSPSTPIKRLPDPHEPVALAPLRLA